MATAKWKADKNYEHWEIKFLNEKLKRMLNLNDVKNKVYYRPM